MPGSFSYGGGAPRYNNYSAGMGQAGFVPNRQEGGGMGGANSGVYARKRTASEQRMAGMGMDPGMNQLWSMQRTMGRR